MVFLGKGWELLVAFYGDNNNTTIPAASSERKCTSMNYTVVTLIQYVAIPGTPGRLE